MIEAARSTGCTQSNLYMRGKVLSVLLGHTQLWWLPMFRMHGDTGIWVLEIRKCTLLMRSPPPTVVCSRDTASREYTFRKTWTRKLGCSRVVFSNQVVLRLGCSRSTMSPLFVNPQVHTPTRAPPSTVICARNTDHENKVFESVLVRSE